ncbi:hypothetical protein ACFLXC_06970 [Chloroflexota bacterium]
MDDDMTIDRQQRNDVAHGNLQETVQILRERFSSVSVETQIAQNGTALNVRFVGDGTNLPERQALASSLAQWLPPALSVIGIGADK